MRCGTLYAAVMEREEDGALRLVSPSTEEDAPGRIVRFVNAADAVAGGLVETLLPVSIDGVSAFDDILRAAEELRVKIGDWRIRAQAAHAARVARGLS